MSVALLNVRGAMAMRLLAAARRVSSPACSVLIDRRVGTAAASNGNELYRYHSHELQSLKAKQPAFMTFGQRHQKPP